MSEKFVTRLTTISLSWNILFLHVSYEFKFPTTNMKSKEMQSVETKYTLHR